LPRISEVIGELCVANENAFGARFGDFEVQASDVVFADDDGCLFLSSENVEE